MCGVVGIVGTGPVNQSIYNSLLMLQHRGQDAAGISTLDSDGTFHMHKDMGYVRDVFHTRNMRELQGNAGVGHVRYPTQGCATSTAECQPFYVGMPYGITMAHNGNLTNAAEVKNGYLRKDFRHVNTTSDSEVLLNVLADEITHRLFQNEPFSDELCFKAVESLHTIVRGSYAVVALIAGQGLLAFRDPNAIRPLCFGSRLAENGQTEYMVSSESLTMAGIGFDYIRDVKPGEAIFITLDGKFSSAQCADAPAYHPCIFEHVYFARPDSVIDGVSVYEARLHLGRYLAQEIEKKMDLSEIDVVMPIPDTSRPAAQEMAGILKKHYREGFIKNRYVARTFIMPGQAMRKKSVRQKLNAIPMEFRDKNVLLVDDSIVRGTTMREIVKLARESGAKKVFVASSAPRVMYPNVYGIDMPTRDELICGHGQDEQYVAEQIGADAVIFQSLEGLQKAIVELNPSITDYDCSCFNGVYVTGDIDQAYIERLEASRK